MFMLKYVVVYFKRKKVSNVGSTIELDVSALELCAT